MVSRKLLKVVPNFVNFQTVGDGTGNMVSRPVSEGATQDVGLNTILGLQSLPSLAICTSRQRLSGCH
jgi:hypothetical protein